MTMDETKGNKAAKKEVEARLGLRLSPDVLAAIKDSRIYCTPQISVVHQQLAKRHVLRGEECGGAVNNLGVYCSYVDEAGKPLSWLQPVETVGPNGRHAIVVASSFVRMQMVRVEHTYDLLITRHTQVLAPGRKKPAIDNVVLFKGRQGTLALDLWGKDADSRGRICPVFYSHSGDVLTIPAEFVEATLVLTAAVCCIGCRHTHLLEPPTSIAIPRVQDAAVVSAGVSA